MESLTENTYRNNRFKVAETINDESDNLTYLFEKTIFQMNRLEELNKIKTQKITELDECMNEKKNDSNNIQNIISQISLSIDIITLEIDNIKQGILYMKKKFFEQNIKLITEEEFFIN